MPPDEVERGHLGEAPDELAVVRPPEAVLVGSCIDVERDPDLPGLRAPVTLGAGRAVSATARSAPNTRRAPEAISAAHARLTGPGPSSVAAVTPRIDRLASSEYVTAEPRK